MKLLNPLAICAAALLVSTAHAQTTLEVIPLKYRSTEQVIPLIRPLLDSEGSVSAFNNQLIIRTSPASLEQIKEVLRKVDTLPRRLMVTVREGGQREAEASGAEVSGSAGIGDEARIAVPPGSGRKEGATVEYRRGEDAARAKVYGTHALEKAEDTQRIQVLEGNQAFIRSGSSVPLPERTVIQRGRGVAVVEGTSWRDATTGFYVRPRISGNIVTLDISPQRNTVGANGRLDVQQAQTTVSGRLGEWIELGGIGKDRSGQGSGVVYSTSGTEAERRSIFIRVEEVK